MIAFAIYPMPLAGGVLGISPTPGRTRHYHADWPVLRDWGPGLVITMSSRVELERQGAGSLPDDLAAAGIAWQHLPVADFAAPDAAITAAWPEVPATTLGLLARGGRVLVHCFGGCGRAGAAALRLMVDAGEASGPALARLRAVRPCAVETEAQRVWAEGG